MRPLISLIIICTLPFLFLSVHEDKVPIVEAGMIQDTSYCNTRFNFCINYPSDLLPTSLSSANDDGIILKNTTNKAVVIVNGSYNITGWYPSDLFQTTVERIGEGAGNAEIIDTKIGDDFYETFFIDDRYQYFNRSFFIDDYYISLLIKVPVDEVYLMKQLREEIQIDYQLTG